MMFPFADTESDDITEEEYVPNMELISKQDSCPGRSWRA